MLKINVTQSRVVKIKFVESETIFGKQYAIVDVSSAKEEIHIGTYGESSDGRWWSSSIVTHNTKMFDHHHEAIDFIVEPWSRYMGATDIDVLIAA